MDHTSQTQVSSNAFGGTSSSTFVLPPRPDAESTAEARGDSAFASSGGPSGLGRDDAMERHDAIEFRVLRAGAPVRRLRLTGNRYTFGSAEGCSIRLNDPALRPMHAVLIRDARRILLRAYSVPVEVNGNRITETTLKVGDVLCMGAYRFELLSVSPDSNATSSTFGETPFASSRSSVLDAHPSGSEATGRIPQSSQPAKRELPPQEDVIWRERLRREVDQWRARQKECDQRESRCDDREANLRGRESELWARAEHLYRRESQLQSQEAAALQIHEEYAYKQQELISLREQTVSRQRAYERRENEFRTLEQQYQQQEIAYRRQVEEATHQLQQSQKQAQAATDAVQRMREQFVALNQQIDELSTQQAQLQQEEDNQRQEHQRLRDELEIARDKAIDGKAESDALRQHAEARVAEMTAQLEAFQAEQGTDLETHKSRLQESEARAQQLRDQVEELQESVVQARTEASQLRVDYEGACESVRNLEQLVRNSNDREDADRESWTAEAEQLRQTVEQLSVDLARANGELSDLREANETLTSHLDEMQRQRDEIRLDADARPTNEAWQSMREELGNANMQLAAMKQEYDATLAKLEADAAQRSAEPRDEILPVADLPVAELPIADLPGNDTPLASTPDADASNQESPGEVSPGEQSERDDDEAWPTYGSPHDRSSEQAETAQPGPAAEVPAAEVPAAEVPAAEVPAAEQPAAEQPAIEEPAADDRSVSDDQPSLITDPVALDSLAEPSDDDSLAGNEVPESSPWSVADSEEVEPVGSENAESPIAEDPATSSIEHTSPWQGTPQTPADEMPLDETPADLPAASSEWANSPPAWDSDAAVGEQTQPLSSLDPAGAHDDQMPASDSASTAWPSENEPSSWDQNPADESLPQSDAWSGESPDGSADADDAWSGEVSEVWSGDAVATDSDGIEDADAMGEACDVTSPWTAAEELETADDPWDSSIDAAGPADHDASNEIESSSLDGDAQVDDDPQEDVAAGSLASMLIQDLDSGNSGDTEVEGTYLMPEREAGSWDLEHPEEARASSWTNESDGDRIESIEEVSPYDLENKEVPEQYGDDQEYDAPRDSILESYDSQDSADLAYDSQSRSDAEVGYEADDSCESAEAEQSYEPESYPAEPEQPVPPAAAAASPIASDGPVDDDSIEAYMNRLLQRVQGESEGDAPQPETVSLSTASPAPAPAQTTADDALNETRQDYEEDSAATTINAPVDPHTPLVPRSEAPERREMSAMRELANESARNAISRSERVQSRDTQIRGMTKFGFAAVALICGVACYIFIPGSIRYLAVGMTVIVAFVCVHEGLQLFAEAKRRLTPADSSPQGDETDFEVDEPLAGPAAEEVEADSLATKEN